MSLVGSLRGHLGSVLCFDLLDLSTGHLLISADESGRVICWDLDSRKTVSSLDIPLNQHEIPQSISHTSPSCILIQLKAGRLLQCSWDVTGLKVQKEHRVGGETFMRVSVWEGFVAVPSSQNGVDVVRLSDEENLTLEWKGISSTHPTGMVMCSKLFKDDDDLCLAVGYDSGALSLFQRDKHKETWDELIYLQVFKESILCLDVAITEEKICVVTGGAGNLIKMIRIAQDRSHEITHVQVEHEGVSSVSINKEFVLAGGWDARVSVFSSTTLGQITTLQGHNDIVNHASICELERGVQSSIRPSLRHHELAITAGKDGLIRFWQLPRLIERWP